MKFIVGIGNPGKKYDGTRHNVGFDVVDRLKKKLRMPGVTLLKPDTFVNRTGEAVAELARRHGARPEGILVVCDDANLDLGKIRLRASGSAGGHHGLESVIGALGSEDFPRLRVGIRQAGMPEDLTEFVLKKFSADEAKRLDAVVERAAAVAESWATDGFEPALNCLSRLQSADH